VCKIGLFLILTKNGTLPSRAWRQKIEAWLQENEKEEKQNEELRRRSRRVQSNRRSLEADSGKYLVIVHLLKLDNSVCTVLC
jgi:hypothetical protein